MRQGSKQPNLKVYNSSGSDLSDKTESGANSANAPRFGVAYKDKSTGEYKVRMPIMPQGNVQGDLEQRLLG